MSSNYGEEATEENYFNSGSPSPEPAGTAQVNEVWRRYLRRMMTQDVVVPTRGVSISLS